jgi:hypothetical protein
MIFFILEEIENIYWYSNVIYFLKNLSCPNPLIGHKRRALMLKDVKYFLHPRWLGMGKCPNGSIHSGCVDKVETNKIIKEFHSGH